ncbi:SMC family ATPase [Lederbergia sp. NSJ-179]|uniref:AAA family ATPase n=1 Tax=Lederbergia sp. NSJ-179 TaxID=2931402 RepID=UPI001FCFB586|nr:SMC family ATPase [Lederbergia sp. NSJ-179]MCJ7841035.1 SMC family ATPase [Lederbergia sp. NSJ-179]
MRPLTLKLTAFGPYKNTETIHFSDLKDQSIFVISGNTGAGKTTIFDGICFALYGSASGQDRENQTMLRSHFAEDDTHTSVELVFELHGRTYRVLRQLGHVKQGNKTKTGERYEFFEICDGKEIPCVDRQMVSEIDKKIEGLMGLTQDQFKQIVMLPQGEFRKLLTSQTENKEDILRRLFKTDAYKQIGERLRNRKKRIELAFQQEKQVRDTYIQNIQATLPHREGASIFLVLSQEHYNLHQVIAGLEEEVAYYNSQIGQDRQNYEKAYKAHTQKQTEFHQAQTLNERLDELEQKKQQLQQLEEQLPIFTEKEKQWEAAERASMIEPYERQVKEWRQEETEKIRAYEQAVRSKNQMDDTYQQVLHAYQQEEGKKEERERIRQELRRLQEFLPVVKEIDQVKQQIQMLEKQAAEMEKQLEAVKKDSKVKSREAEEMSQKIADLDKAVSEYPEKSERLAMKREQWKLLNEYTKLAKRQTALAKEMQQKKELYEQKQANYQERERSWLNHQALVLASHLHDGEPCPVCGSLEHPHKATNEGHSITREQLEELKKKVDVCENDYHLVRADWSANTKQLEEKQQEVESNGVILADIPLKMEELKKEGKQLNEEVEKLKADRFILTNWKTEYEERSKELKQLEANKEKWEQRYQEKRLKMENTKTIYLERIRIIPEEMRVLDQLEKQIRLTEHESSKREQAWEQVQKRLQQTQNEQTKAQSNLEHAQKQHMETTAKREKAEVSFQEVLQKAEFANEEEYRLANMSNEAREELKRDIDHFKQTRSLLQEQVKELKSILKGQKKVDLTLLQQQLENFKQAYEAAFNQWEQSKKFYQEANHLLEKIADAEKRVRESERKLAVLADLYDVIRGQNHHKISFERYLQIEYLERIIEAANLRLKKLSNGQYDLIRSDRQESHGRQSGLALDIYDSYTGQTRDVKTLSGGEKFNASLCLALGMSDVIQSFQGNISIDTMFIDEGFGTLDEEALNKAIDTLVDLQQSGRMIGVISHVQELKAIFPAILEVKKTKEGHSQTRFILK